MALKKASPKPSQSKPAELKPIAQKAEADQIIRDLLDTIAALQTRQNDRTAYGSVQRAYRYLAVKG